MEFDSVDRHAADGYERWRSAGSPPVPSIEIDGTTTTIMHVGQVARLLDLPAPPMLDQSRVAYDLVLLIDSWERMIRPLPPDAIVQPTASRGRSLRNLTMNAVYPISLVADAYATGTFDWGLVARDEVRAEPYADARSLADFVHSVHAAWSSFVVAYEDELGSRDDWIEAPRGRMRFSELLAHQRWHLAFHHLQVVEFLETLGRDVGAERDLAASIGVDLPEAIT